MNHLLVSNVFRDEPFVESQVDELSRRSLRCFTHRSQAILQTFRWIAHFVKKGRLPTAANVTRQKGIWSCAVELSLRLPFWYIQYIYIIYIYYVRGFVSCKPDLGVLHPEKRSRGGIFCCLKRCSDIETDATQTVETKRKLIQNMYQHLTLGVSALVFMY